MASEKEFLDFVLEQLSLCGEISYKKMIGEYMLYKDGKYFAAVCDDRLLFKITDGNKVFGMEEAAPYPGAKPMYLADNLDDKELLSEITAATLPYLKNK